MSNVFGRTSGSRYLLPADWTIYFYFIEGIASVLMWIRHGHIDPEVDTSRISRNYVLSKTQKKLKKALVLSGLKVFLAGTVMPVVDSSFPKLYGEKNYQELVRQVSAITKNSIVGTNEEQLLKFIETQGGKVISGRILYPRYLKFDEADQNGLFISVLTPEIIEVFIPIKKTTDNIKGGSDVIVIGCPADGYLTDSCFDT